MLRGKKVVVLLLVVFAAPVAFGGGGHVGIGTGLTQPARAAFQFSGRFKLLLLTHRDGHTLAVPVNAPLALGQGLPVPKGDWVEVAVVFDGPVFLLGPTGDLTPLPLRTLRVPIENPDADHDRVLFLDLPVDLSALSGAALISAVSDGTLAID